MLIDVHAHFYTERSGRADWKDVNARRLAAGERIGTTQHVASILGSWGHRSPTYFPSPDDVSFANDFLLALQQAYLGKVFGYCVVNPNYAVHALGEIERCVNRGMIGIKLAASRRVNDRLLDPVAELGGNRGVPLLFHIWQHRRRDWPGQEASDAAELVELAWRHPTANFILAHIGGGGDWSHSIRALQDIDNVWVDLSGSGVDVDMLHSLVGKLGCNRLVWGTDLTMDTGWAKLRYLEARGLSSTDLALITHENALTIFPPGVFDAGD